MVESEAVHLPVAVKKLEIVSEVIAWFVVLFGINITRDISK